MPFFIEKIKKNKKRKNTMKLDFFASQAEGRGFESRFPLQENLGT